jgi:NAD+ diphosphatase
MTLNAYVNTFAGSPLDRGGDHRRDKAWIAAKLADPAAEAIALWQGRPLVEETPDGDTRLARLPAPLARDVVAGRDERLAFLGLDGSTPVFAVEFEGAADPSEGALKARGRFEELRALAARLPEGEAAIAGLAKTLFDWRLRHRFCPACGQESEVADGGWRRICPACKTEHYPRVDPVVIMLVHDGADRCLLGRQPSWAPGRMSALAGFLEPGESIEEACAREVQEEAGLTVRAVEYHSSQPWPFPSSLMIGLFAEVEPGEAVPDLNELEAVRWFTRAQVRTMLTEGECDGVNPAPRFAIARRLLEAWAARG